MTNELTERLRAHADAHEYIAGSDDEQKQWMDDLREAAAAIERLQAENVSFRAAMKACSALRPVGDADICGGMSDALSAETTALRKDLDDVLDALRHLRSCQHRPPIIDGDSEAWWRAAVDEADLLLTRFAIPTVQQESDHWGIP